MSSSRRTGAVVWCDDEQVRAVAFGIAYEPEQGPNAGAVYEADL